MTEKTLVLLKPDAVQRSLMGEILSRFERAGFKVAGMKLVQVDAEFAKKHYTEDLAIRKGEKVREMMVAMITSAPVLAICLEGANAIENIRKMIGATEPKSALPGTIRGDFAHVSYAYADAEQIGVKNLVHASADTNDASVEVPLWFSDKELYAYKNVNDIHILS